jgi:2-oxo-4-hydroxy-4-carboxy-5-ureidoimidazoline decarboxylase
MAKPYSLAQLNAMSQAEFVAALGATFEDTPAIAAHAWQSRPFRDRAHLQAVMTEIVLALPAAEQLALIRAHPDLGSRTQMAPASVQEQAGVGLDRLSASDYQRFQDLNQAYRDKFGFPLIVAVRGRSTADILAEFGDRLANPPTQERERAIAQILQIAQFRLQDWVLDDGTTVTEH